MSTPIKSTRVILELVKSLSLTADRLITSPNPTENKFAQKISGLLNEFKTNENVESSRYDIEKELFSFIVDSNITSHKMLYDDRANQSMLDKAETQKNAAIGNIEKLDSVGYVLTGMNSTEYAALYRDVIHGLDMDDDKTNLIKDFIYDVFQYAIESHSEYPDREISLPEAATAIMSVNAWGNSLLDSNEPLSYRSLETQGFYESGMSRTFYGSDVIAGMLIESKGESARYQDTDVLGIAPEYGTVTNKYMPSLTGLSGLPVRITSDIPEPELKDAFIVAKELFDISDKFKDRISGEVAERFSRTYCSTLVSSLPEYENYFSFDKRKMRYEDTLSL